MARILSRVTCPLLVAVLCLPLRAGTVYVRSGSPCVGVCGTDCGQSWLKACRDLQAGINAAAPGDEVWVAEGAYGPIKLKSGVKVLGGFAGSEGVASSSDPEVHKSIIDGGGVARAVVSIQNDPSTVLRGFVIQGGAVRNKTDAGGGLYLEGSSPIVARCLFTNNTSDYAGGAVANYFGGSPKFVNCRFVSNGGVADGTMPVGGGAVFNHDGAPSFVNCLFYGNKAGEGGAVLTLAGAVELINCTLAGNEATKLKGGALFDNRGDAVVRNCVLWGNVAKKEHTEEIYNNPTVNGMTSVTHSTVKGAWPGIGNINADPLFVDASKNDYRIQAASPCREAGQVSALPADVADLGFNGNITETLPHDLDMNARVVGGSVDMGAYEWMLEGE